MAENIAARRPRISGFVLDDADLTACCQAEMVLDPNGHRGALMVLLTREPE